MDNEVYRSGKNEPEENVERREFIYVEGRGFADPLIGLPHRNKIRIYANAVGYALLCFLTLQNVVPLMVVSCLRLVHPAIRIYNGSFLASGDVIELVGIVSALICYGVPVGLLYTVLRIPARVAFPLRRAPLGEWLPCIGIVLASSAVGSSVSMLLSAAFSTVGLYPTGPNISQPETWGLLLMSIVSSALLPAICEEALFRGVLLQSMRRFGDLFALCITSLLFALLHRNFVQFPNALMTGLLLGYLSMRTGTLRVPMLCHFINNLIPLLLGAFSYRLSDGVVGVLYLSLNFLYLLLGVAAIVFLLIRRSYVFRPVRGEGWRIERGKYRSFFSSVPMLVLLCLLCTMILMNMLV